MFQKLISLTPVAIASEIENILKSMPWELSQRFHTSPELQEKIIQEVLLEFAWNQALSHEVYHSCSIYKASTAYPYIQQEQLQLLVRYNLFRTLDELDQDKSSTRETATEHC